MTLNSVCGQEDSRLTVDKAVMSNSYKTHDIITMLCVENLYVEVNVSPYYKTLYHHSDYRVKKISSLILL